MKKAQPKKVSFGPKPQTPVCGHNLGESSSFTTPAPQSSNTISNKTSRKPPLSHFLMQKLDVIEPIKLEPLSPILPHHRCRTALSNLKPLINKTWKTFTNQGSTDYLSSAFNMVGYKKGC